MDNAASGLLFCVKYVVMFSFSDSVYWQYDQYKKGRVEKEKKQTWWDIEQGHRNGGLRSEDGVVSHGPLLREGQAPKLSGLREGLLELEGHVLGAKRLTGRMRTGSNWIDFREKRMQLVRE